MSENIFKLLKDLEAIQCKSESKAYHEVSVNKSEKNKMFDAEFKKLLSSMEPKEVKKLPQSAHHSNDLNNLLDELLEGPKSISNSTPLVNTTILLDDILAPFNNPLITTVFSNSTGKIDLSESIELNALNKLLEEKFPEPKSIPMCSSKNPSVKVQTNSPESVSNFNKMIEDMEAEQLRKIEEEAKELKFKQNEALRIEAVRIEESRKAEEDYAIFKKNEEDSDIAEGCKGLIKNFKTLPKNHQEYLKSNFRQINWNNPDLVTFYGLDNSKLAEIYLQFHEFTYQ